VIFTPGNNNLVPCGNRNLLTVKAKEAGTSGYEEKLFLVRVEVESRDHNTVIFRIWPWLAGRKRKRNRGLFTDEIGVVVK
jgi:hypothetical protein